MLRVDPANPPMIAHPVGCDKCRKSGYKGRVAVTEILPFNDAVDELVLQEAPLSQVKAAAVEAGFVPVVDDATAKILEGVTSVDAAIKIVDFTDRI